MGDGSLDDVSGLVDGFVGLFLGLGELALWWLPVGDGHPGSDVALIGDAPRGADFLQDAGGGDGLGVVDGPGQGGRRPTVGARSG